MSDQAQTPVVNLSRYIETRLMENRPHVRDRRVPVALIAHSAHSQGWSIEELAYQFTLSETEVLAALLYYQQHTSDIEAIEAAEQRRMDEMHRLYGEQN